MCEMDEEILKLNQHITKLITENLNLVEVNQRIKRDFERLRGEIDEHRRSAIESCELSDKYKFDLEKEIQIREAIFEAHQKQKSKFLSLNEENYLLKERVKSLENALEHRRPSQPFGTLRGLQLPEGNNRASMSHPPIRRSTAPSRKTIEIERLQIKIDGLNKELAESNELINELEFELDSVVYYEQEIKTLRTKLDELTVESKRTNPFESEDNDCDQDSVSREPSYDQLVTTESEEKSLKRMELQHKLKQFHAKQETGTSSISSSTRLVDMHEQLKSI